MVRKRQSESVVRVDGGNAFKTEKGETFRIAGVNPPELGEFGYEEVTRRLRKLIEGKEVKLERLDPDHDGQEVANVYVGGESVRTAMQNYIEAIEEQRQKNEPEKAGLFKKFESLSKIIDLLVKWAVWLAIVFGWLLGWLTSAFLS